VKRKTKYVAAFFIAPPASRKFCIQSTGGSPPLPPAAWCCYFDLCTCTCMCAWLHGSCIVLVDDVADLKIRDAERMGQCSPVW